MTISMSALESARSSDFQWATCPLTENEFDSDREGLPWYSEEDESVKEGSGAKRWFVENDVSIEKALVRIKGDVGHIVAWHFHADGNNGSLHLLTLVPMI